jgi:flagellar biosynthesis chaperone FliJ
MQENSWQFSKKLDIGIVVQVILLASLIVGSWVNLQRQLDIVQHDINLLIENQKQWHDKVDELNNRCISYEYRLRSLERK